ncbi:thioesterase domain-containing protein [Nocardia cyriacigeorgica]|uniref:Alpha/beta hydrolase fold domain-containing protein n=1 Tax=Nocardia cyriacigeorgica TaxID=135487 RepID=A0A6P1DGP7_9NOCA|nr:thioesterase domain-containing protein [Nocardia cyriacigeorgica]NEW47743.1 alpha/beta hydrolase fold domain-containing protein [Nocardia cyriacigeorgica]
MTAEQGQLVETTDESMNEHHPVEWCTIPTPTSLPKVAPCDWTEALHGPDTDTAQVIVLDCRRDESGALPTDTHAMTQKVSTAVQSWSGQRRFDSSTFLVLTRGAISVSPDEVVHPTGSAIWELVKSARTETPGRIILVDTDSPDKGLGDLSGLMAVRNMAVNAIASAEPQLAIRGNILLAPRGDGRHATDGDTVVAESAEQSPAVSSPSADPTIVRMFRQAIADDKFTDGLEFLLAAAQLRPAFDHHTAAIPTGIGLSGGTPHNTGGDTLPHVVLICTPAFLGGYIQYILLAAHLGGHRRLSVIPLSGYEPDEPLPASPDAAIESIATSVLDTVGEDEFVLAGMSGGGNLAHATAARILEQGNTRLQGLIIFDSFIAREANERQMETVRHAVVDTEAMIPDLAGFTTARLTALACWLELLQKLEYQRVECEALVIKCTKPSPTHNLNEWPIENWSTAQTVRTVDAEHVALCSTEAHTTAQVVDQWLRQLSANDG